MTDPHRRGRGLVGLALVPLAAGLFGAGVMWADSHDPTAPTSAAPAPSADPKLEGLAVQVADAQARVAAIRAALEQGAVGATASTAPPAPAPPPGPVTAPAAPPPVDTTTKASG